MTQETKPAPTAEVVDLGYQGSASAQERRIEEGKCRECGKNDALPDLTICEECREIKRTRNARRDGRPTLALAETS